MDTHKAEAVFFLEHAHHLPVFLENLNRETDLVVVLSPEASLILDREGIPYKVLFDYYHDDDMVALIQENSRDREEKLRHLDELLWSVDKRFREEYLPAFWMFWSSLLFVLDAPKVMIFELNRLFAKERITSVKIISDESRVQETSEGYLACDPVYNAVIRLLKGVHHYEIKETFFAGREVKLDEPGKVDVLNKALSKIKNYVRRAERILGDLFRTPPKKHHILSVLCSELWPIRSALVYKGWRVTEFSVQEFRKISFVPYSHSRDLIAKIERYRADFSFNGIEYYDIVAPKLEGFVKELEFFWLRYIWIKSFFKSHHFDLVILSSLSARNNLHNPLWAFVCMQKRIPYICWSHGGIGAYDKTPTTVDLPISHHYFVFGEAVKHKLEQIGTDVHLHVSGSPRIERFLEMYERPNNTRRTLVYWLPQDGVHNQLHLRNFHPVFRLSYSPTIFRIIQILQQFQSRYRIVVKMSGEALRRHLEGVLAGLGGGQIELIGSEKGFSELLSLSDLVILNWVSTSFWEAACTQADIFLLDEGHLTEPAKQAVEERAFLYRDFEAFRKGLEAYLQKREFYQKKSDRFLSEFMDLPSKDRRGEKVHTLLESIVNRPDFRPDFGSLERY